MKKNKIRTEQLYQLGHTAHFSQEKTNVLIFEVKVGEIIDRLEILGYSLDKSENQFKISLTKVLSTQFSDINGNPDFIYPSFPDQEAFESPRISREFISNITFQQFKTACTNIIKSKKRRIIKNTGGLSKSIIPEDVSNPLERYLICNGLGVIQFQDKIDYIRILLDNLDKNSTVQYIFEEISQDVYPDVELFYSSNYNPKELVSKYGLQTLIITEGITDSYFLKIALTYFYPHLTDLFYFLDFNLKDGNSESVIQVTLSLAASGIPNNIVAIFDNDSEGNRAKSVLESKLDPLPSNVYILSYPYIEIANNYPVLKAKDVIEYQNINGLGCAIEMYLGKEILSFQGKLTPVTERPGYQFKFRDKIKKEIQQKFKIKCDTELEKVDLSGLKLIVDSILSIVKK